MVADDGNKAVRFSDRDMKVFRYHLPRFRLTTNEALRRLFGVSSVNTVNKWVSRRRDQGYLTTARLTGDAAVDFHQVTAKAVEQFGLDENAAEPFRGQTLPRFYGMLSFCWLGPRPYRKLSRAEFKNGFPELLHRHLEEPHYYYLDDDYQPSGGDSKKRIGYIYVDDGKSLWAIMKRVRELMSQRLRLWPWKPLITERKRFLITIVTTDNDRKWQLEMELNSAPRPVPVRVEVREDLESVIPEKPGRATKR